jgi:hypothetical protein
MDHKTLARYIDLLEKAFVIIRLGGFSRNLRNEIVKKNKFYFYDKEREGKLFGFECKWSDKKIKVPKSWQQNYPDSTVEVIHPDIYQKFIL